MVGGYLVDKLGSGIVGVSSSLMVTIGQAVFLLGLVLKSYSIALVGTGVFSLGGECLGVSQIVIISEWFKDKKLSTAISIALSISKTGRVLSSAIQPQAALSESLIFSYSIGIFVCFFCLLCSIGAFFINTKKNTLLENKKNLNLKNNLKLADLRRFRLIFWLTCLSIIFFFVDILCFLNIASSYYQKRFDYDSVEAGNIINIAFIINVFLIPLTGALSDHLGRRSECIILSTITVALAHIGFIVTPGTSKAVYPIFYMVLLGLGHSVYFAVIWSSINDLAPAKFVGNGFGIAYSGLNFGQFFGPIVVGYITETTAKDKDYFWVSAFFVLVGIAGTLVSIAIYINDINNGRVLRSPKQIIPQKFSEGYKPLIETPLISG